MPDRYWVGGTASWDGTAGTKWATTSGGAGGASVPTSADDVFFTNLSTGTCTIATGNTGARSINCTGFAGTIAGTASITVSGSVTFVAGMTLTYTGTLTINAAATLTTGGKTLGSVTFNSAGTTLTLGSACTLGASNQFTLTAGTLDLAGFTLSAGIFSSSNSNTRSISFGSANIALISATAGTTILSMATATNFTFTGSGGFTRNQGATATVTFGSSSGGSATNAPNLSITAGASTLTITSGSFFKNLNFTGSTCSVSGAVNIAGDLTFASGGTYTSLVPTFIASSVFTTNGRSVAAGNVVDINCPGGTVTLVGTLTIPINVIIAGGFTLTAGTFDAGTSNVNATYFFSTGSSNRVLNMGTGTWTLTGISGSNTIWQVSGSNVTVNSSTSTITLVATDPVFQGGGYVYNSLLLNTNSSTGVALVRGSNTFNSIGTTVTGRNVQIAFEAGSTNTLSNLNFSATAPYSFVLRSGTPGTTFTLSKPSGTVTVDRVLIQDSVATGGATWNATNSVNLGNNTGWNITASPGRYWVGGAASWDGTAGTKWAISSGGTGGATVPGLVDPVYIDSASGANTVTIATGNFGCQALICTGFTGTLTGTAGLSVFGDVTLDAALTMTYTGTITLKGGPSTITPAGKTFGAIALAGDGSTDAPELQPSVITSAPLIITNSLTLTSGSFNANNQDITVGGFSSSSTAIRTLTMGSGLWTLTATGSVWNIVSTNLTFNVNTANILLSSLSTSARSFTGGGLTYNKVTIGGGTGTSTLTINGSNTFDELASIKAVPHTIAFEAGTTQTFTTWSVTGTLGNVVTLQSTTAGSPYTLAKAGGGFLTGIDYLSIRDARGSPLSDTWYVGANSSYVTTAPNSGYGLYATQRELTAVVVLTSTTSTTWTVPSDWNSNSNSIHLFGGGGGGAGNGGVGANLSGGAGGGGGYTRLVNQVLTPGLTATYQAGSGGAGANSVNVNASSGGPTNWNYGGVVSTANGGGGGRSSNNSGIGGSGGTGSTFNGGAGVSSGNNSFGGPGGGGGAGGPNGAGRNGGAGTNNTTQANMRGGGGGGNGGGSIGGNGTSGGSSGVGGNNSAGLGGGIVSTGGPANGGAVGGGGAGAVSTNLFAGAGSTGFDVIVGIGGGGGGGANGGNSATFGGGNGGLFGGGGGGAYWNIGGSGAQGGIVILYTPFPGTGNFFFFMPS